MNAEINNGLSDDSKEALKGKRGEDIVNADVAGQGYETTTAETDRNIEIKWYSEGNLLACLMFPFACQPKPKGRKARQRQDADILECFFDSGGKCSHEFLKLW